MNRTADPIMGKMARRDIMVVSNRPGTVKNRLTAKGTAKARAPAN
jgi:hypothetical protein